MSNPPQPGRTPTYTQYNEPRGQQIPYPIRSSQMQSYQERERKNKRWKTNAEQRDTRRSTHIQVPWGNNKQQKQSYWPYSWNRKESERCYWQYNCRNRKQRVQRNQNASNMADGRCHHHTHNDICMWRVDNQQGRKQKTPMHIQRSNKNPTIPTQRNPHNDPPERNRQHTNRIYHQDKENPTSQTHRPNERRIPNKGCHASQNKNLEEHVIDLTRELHIYDQMAILSKETLKHCIQKEIETKMLE